MAKKQTLSEQFYDIFLSTPLRFGSSMLLAVVFSSQAANLAYDESERHKDFLEDNNFSNVITEDKNFVISKALSCGIGSDFTYSAADGIRKEGLICNGIWWNNDEITITLNDNTL